MHYVQFLAIRLCHVVTSVKLYATLVIVPRITLSQDVAENVEETESSVNISVFLFVMD